MMGWYQGDWGFAGMLGMGMMVLVWGALIGLAVWAIARFTRTEPSHSPSLESARAILDRRFASGEIDAEEYARTRRTLATSDAQDLTPSKT
jgi:putative membrane protein